MKSAMLTTVDTHLTALLKDGMPIPSDDPDEPPILTPRLSADERRKTVADLEESASLLLGMVREYTLAPFGLLWAILTLNSSHKPYSDSLTAHNGNLDIGKTCQSGVYLTGRDRSKAGVLKKEVAKKRELEEESDGEAILTPRKKVLAPFGTYWARLTCTDPFWCSWCRKDPG